MNSVIRIISKQMILVITDTWNDFHAKLYLCENIQKKWVVQKNFPAVCGERGLAWGIGLFPQTLIKSFYPVKQEGDLKSPAGVFQLGPCLGYAPRLQINPKLEYRQLTETIQGVDDPASKYYNQIVDIAVFKDSKEFDWNSYEKMKRNDDLYKWLVVIKHNPSNIPGAGSLIFLHIWETENSGTAGCTAVAEQTILEIVKWLDMSKNPVLAQMPKEIYDRNHSDWGLPLVQ